MEMKMREKLYAVAIFAYKPDPEHQVTSNQANRIQTRFPTRNNETEANYDVVFGIRAGVERAASEEIAREAALRQAQRIWPESEGWTLHNANALEIESNVILTAAAAIESERPSLNEAEEREM
jgi:hypothetical protein